MPKPTDRGPIAGIVLAAGQSKRLGRPKQLLDIAGTPLVAHVVDRCLSSQLDQVFVVVGHEADAVRQSLAGYDVRVVDNPRYADGQSTSLVAGLEAAAEADAIVVVLGDQPGIQTPAIDRLLAARRKKGALAGMAAYGAERGHPVMFGRELFHELRQLTGDKGGREILRRHATDLVLVDGGSMSVPQDIDREADYRALRETWGHRDGG